MTVQETIAFITFKVANLFTVKIRALERVPVRGGSIVEVDWNNIAREGYAKILDYGLGRYLRDGARTHALLPYHDIPSQWNDMDRIAVVQWMLDNGAKTVTDNFDTVTHISVDKTTMKAWLKLSRIPGFENPQEFRIWFQQDLDMAALENGRTKYDHLCTGQIPEGRGRTASMSPFEKTFRRLATEIAKHHGWSPKEDGPIPNDLDDAKALFVRLGINSAKTPNPEKYFDAFLGHVHNIAAQEAMDI